MFTCVTRGGSWPGPRTPSAKNTSGCFVGASFCFGVHLFLPGFTGEKVNCHEQCDYKRFFERNDGHRASMGPASVPQEMDLIRRRLICASRRQDSLVVQNIGVHDGNRGFLVVIPAPGV